MPTATPQRLLILIGIGLLVIAWWYTAMLPWRADRLATNIVNRRAPTNTYNQVPLAPEPARTAAKRLLAADAPDYAQIDTLLAYSLNLRPIYAPYWLDRAEAAYQAGNLPAAERHLATVTDLWPTRPTLLWKAAMLQARLGNVDAALATLNSYLRAEPRGYRETIAVASRLEDDPARMLNAVLPAATPDPERFSRDDIVWRILRDAGAANNTELGRAAWRALAPEARENPELVSHYVEWMVAAEEAEEAVSTWASYRNLDPLPPLENNSFEATPRGGLGWRIYDRSGARIDRDSNVAAVGASSLRIAFPGNENVNFYHVRQYLPVAPGQRYILGYTWRGDAVSTRSGPYIEVRAPGEGRLAAGKDQWGSWDWQRATVAFTVPETVHFVEVRVRRNKTDALDNEIAGVVWLDDFALAPEDGKEVAD